MAPYSFLCKIVTSPQVFKIKLYKRILDNYFYNFMEYAMSHQTSINRFEKSLCTSKKKNHCCLAGFILYIFKINNPEYPVITKDSRYLKTCSHETK